MTYELKRLSFQAFFDIAVDAMLLTDDSGQIVRANPVAQRLFGYSKNELESQNIEFLIVPRYRKQYRYYQSLFLTRKLST